MDRILIKNLYTNQKAVVRLGLALVYEDHVLGQSYDNNTAGSLSVVYILSTGVSLGHRGKRKRRVTRIAGIVTYSVKCAGWLLTFSPPIPLRLYTLPYWSNPPFLISDI